jgi:hypothetical protein
VQSSVFIARVAGKLPIDARLSYLAADCSIHLRLHLLPGALITLGS